MPPRLALSLCCKSTVRVPFQPFTALNCPGWAEAVCTAAAAKTRIRMFVYDVRIHRRTRESGVHPAHPVLQCAIMTAMCHLALLLLLPACGSLWSQPFTPPTGRGCPVTVLGGPCGRRLMSARSDDGLTFKRTNHIVTDQGDVPDLVIDSNGWIYLYYVGATV